MATLETGSVRAISVKSASSANGLPMNGSRQSWGGVAAHQDDRNGRCVRGQGRRQPDAIQMRHRTSERIRSGTCRAICAQGQSRRWPARPQSPRRSIPPPMPEAGIVIDHEDDGGIARPPRGTGSRMVGAQCHRDAVPLGARALHDPCRRARPSGTRCVPAPNCSSVPCVRPRTPMRTPMPPPTASGSESAPFPTRGLPDGWRDPWMPIRTTRACGAPPAHRRAATRDRGGSAARAGGRGPGRWPLEAHVVSSDESAAPGRRSTARRRPARWRRWKPSCGSSSGARTGSLTRSAEPDGLSIAAPATPDSGWNPLHVWRACSEIARSPAMALESTRTDPIPTKAPGPPPACWHPPMKRNWPGWPESRRRTAHTDAITRWWPRERSSTLRSRAGCRETRRSPTS